MAPDHDPPLHDEHTHRHERPRGFWTSHAVQIALLAGLLLAVAWTTERWLGLPHHFAVALYLASGVLGGWDLVEDLVRDLRKKRFTFDVHLLMLLAAAGAAVLGAWAEGAFLLFLFALAHALEHYAMDRARSAIRGLADLAPTTARVRQPDGSDKVIPINEVSPGDVVVVRPGDRVPVDGQVVSGHSAVNQAPITGESVPVEKTPGDAVYAGTVNGDGAMEVSTTAAAGDRTLDRVVKLVQEAQHEKAPTQRFTDRFEQVFVPIVLLASGLMALLPPLLLDWTWGTAFYRAMALLVGASPCALALGTPAAVLAGIARAARGGVLIKGGESLENLGALRAVAFDKTGTLTAGRPELTDVVPASGVTDTQLLRVSAAVEALSAHPLADAVVRRAQAQNLVLPAATDLESLTARGVRATVDGQRVAIGRPQLWQADGVTLPDAIESALTTLRSAGRSVMAVQHGERWLGVLGVADAPRPGVRQSLERMRALGLGPLVMLTGDHAGVGQAVGHAVGVDNVQADLLPQDKVHAVKQLLAQHGQVAMVGDGVNDAPALAHATVGIAMGGAGSAVALETADVALMGDDLDTLVFAVGLSRQARRIIVQNLVIALGVIVILIVATATGGLGIGPAVFFHEGSTLVVLVNALRLLAYSD